MRGLERPDALFQPVFEREIIREPAEKRLTEVNVSLDETRKDNKTRAVDCDRF